MIATIRGKGTAPTAMIVYLDQAGVFEFLYKKLRQDRNL